MKESKIDIKENYIYRLDNELLTILLHSPVRRKICR